MTRTTENLVVGGGLAGLTAAAWLARAGRKVVVLDSASEIGGRARTRNHDGFFLNLGPHALYNGGEASKVLRELGIRITGRTPGSEGAFALKDGTLYPIPARPLQLLTADLLSWRAKWEVARFFANLKSIRTADLNGISVRHWLDSRFDTLDGRNFAAGLMRVATYCADEGQSAAIAIRQLQLGFGGGVMYLDHGWQTMVDQLEAVAVSSGAEIRSRAQVRSVEDRRAITDDGPFEAEHVIVATPRLAASRLLNLSPVDRIPARAACLTLCLSRLPRPDRWFVLGVDGPYYLSVHTAWAKMAPGSGALVHVMKYLKPGESTGVTDLESLMTLAQPGWRDGLVHSEFLPQIHVSDAIPAGFEAIVETGRQEVEIAGDWTGGNILADAAFASGRRAAKRVLQQVPRAYESVA